MISARAGVLTVDLPSALICQQEARRSIKGPSRIDPDLYRRVVDRRQLFVPDGMALGPQDTEQTASVSAPSAFTKRYRGNCNLPYEGGRA